MVALQWLLLLLAGAAAVLSANWRRRRHQQLRLPPGPKGWPILGNLGVVMSKSQPLHQVLHRVSQDYGPIMFLRLGSKPTVVISSSEVAKEMFKDYDKEFASRPYMTVNHILGYGEDDMILAPYGPRWRFMRRIVTQELLALQRVHQFEAFRAEETSRMIKSILTASQGSSSSAGPPLDMTRRSCFLVMNMMTRILMNKRFFDDSADATGHAVQDEGNHDGLESLAEQPDDQEKVASEFKEMIDETFYLSALPIIGDFIPSLGFLDRIMNYKAAMLRGNERYTIFFKRVLEEHRQRQQRHKQHGDIDGDSQKAEFTDFVDILISQPGENGQEKLKETMIYALLMDMFNAGVDTSSNTIQWGLSELLRHPEILRKVQEELDSVVGKDRVVVEADLPSLLYFQAVVKEVFRLHPAAPLMVPHVNNQHCQIAGFDFPAGTVTYVNVWSIGRDAKVWDNPLQFQPERFMGAGASDIDVRGKHFELLPFGTGRRGCPGMHLGIAVVQQTLARLVHSFDWSLPSGVEPHDLDMTEGFAFTLPRATPLLAFAQPRLPLHLY